MPAGNPIEISKQLSYTMKEVTTTFCLPFSEIVQNILSAVHLNIIVDLKGKH